jgi:hypothetical protein
MLFIFVCGQARATHLSGQNWQTAVQIKFVADLLNNLDSMKMLYQLQGQM